MARRGWWEDYACGLLGDVLYQGPERRVRRIEYRIAAYDLIRGRMAYVGPERRDRRVKERRSGYKRRGPTRKPLSTLEGRGRRMGSDRRTREGALRGERCGFEFVYDDDGSQRRWTNCSLPMGHAGEHRNEDSHRVPKGAPEGEPSVEAGEATGVRPDRRDAPVASAGGTTHGAARRTLVCSEHAMEDDEPITCDSPGCENAARWVTAEYFAPTSESPTAPRSEEAQVAALVEALELAEWGGGHLSPSCPVCGFAKSTGHANTCEIRRALATHRRDA